MTDPHAPSLRHQLGLAAAIAGGAGLLAAIVAGLGADQDWPIDRKVRSTLAAKRHPRIRATLRVVGSAGTVGFYAPAALAMATLTAYKRDINHAFPPIATVALAAGGTALLKLVVRRERPETPTGPVNERHSFPSGHATRATATALMGAYLLVRERIVPAEVAMPAAVALALATGASRTYADAHWTTDVIGGWALGAAAAAGGALWYEQVRAEAHDDD